MQNIKCERIWLKIQELTKITSRNLNNVIDYFIKLYINLTMVYKQLAYLSACV